MSKRETKKEKLARRSARRRNRFLPDAIGLSGGVLLAGAAFYFFSKQAERVVEGRADHFDETVMTAVHRIDSPEVTAVMRAITQLGSHAAIGTAAGLTAIALRRRGNRSDAWTIVLHTAGAMALNTALKAVFQRRRPHERARHMRLPRSHSFPSGHSLLSAATYPIVAHQLVRLGSTRRIALAQGSALVVIVLVGFSRVYFGVHFPSDVLGGYAAGIGWLGLNSLTHSMVREDHASR